jgi:hypothetical protein
MKRRTRSWGLLLVVAILIGIATADAVRPASAQTRKPAKPTLAQQIAEQKRRIDQQQTLIEHQRALIDSQRVAADSLTATLAAQAARLAAMDSAMVTMRIRLEALESQSGFPAWEDSLEARIREVEKATQK